MNWNPFDLIGPAFNRVKERLLPFNFKDWFKLSFISLFSGNPGTSFNFGNYGNVSNNNLPANSGGSISSFFRNNGLIIGAILLFIFLIYTIFSYIQSVFNFIFVDDLVNNKKAKGGFLSKILLIIFLEAIITSILIMSCFVFISIDSLIFILVLFILIQIGFFIVLLFILDLPKSFVKNHSKGLSLFWFKILISIIALILFSLLALPYIYNWLTIGSLWLGWGYLIFSILITIILLIIFWLIFLFVYDLIVPYMYVKNVSAFKAWKKVWRRILKNKVETLVYWVSRLLLSLGLGIALVIAIIILVLVFGLIAVLFFLIGLGLYYAIGYLVIIYVIFVFILLAIIFGISMMIVSMPISVFFRYFGFLNFEKLTNLKILNNNSKK